MRKPFHLLGLAAVVCLLAAPAQAIVIEFSAALTGPAESPPVDSDGTGLALVTIDTLAHTMEIEASFSGLESPSTVAHIHCCTALPGTGTIGVATAFPSFPGFP